MSNFYLEIISGQECGARYILNDGASSIGRSSQNTIALSSEEKVISSHHAIIYKSPEKILIQDLQSTNGTYINETRINETDIYEGDVIGFGKTGPRLKLLRSEKSTPDETVNRISFELPTTENNCHTDDNCEKDIYNANTNSGESLTMELERKLFRKDISDLEALKLMGNKRLEKIIDSGALGKTQSGLLAAIHRVNKKSKRNWIYACIALLFLTIVTSLFSGFEIHQYRKRPLINEVEEKEKSLTSMKSHIETKDFDRLYRDKLEKRIDEILRRFGESNYNIPVDMVERVHYHVEYYSKELKPVIQRYLDRKARYFPMINEIFSNEHIPPELAYVSMLESGFNPNALSKAGAKGLWQFMISTGRKYGLSIDDTLDERTDPRKATYAAAKYFKELIGIFGAKSSVMLCLAAYNAGEGKMINILRNIDDPVRNRDFWYIYRMGYLTEETNEYIPRVLALMIISEHPAEFGFQVEYPPSNDSQPVDDNDFVEIDFRVK